MNSRILFAALLTLTLIAIPLAVKSQFQLPVTNWDDQIRVNSANFLEQGRNTFRYDTFGDEAFWGDTLKLHQALAGAALGGVGPGVSPRTALSVGLKVDSDALPLATANAIRAGQGA